MLPLRDSIPRVHKPFAMWLIMAFNVLIYLYQSGLGELELVYLYHVFGIVPARLFDPAWAARMGYPGDIYLSAFTYMFLHAGFWHLLLNMWTLWIFGDNIEDTMGPFRFLTFYIICGLAALGAHLAFNMNSTTPVLGASGAIAGIMGAYFLLYPNSKVLILIPIFFIPYFIEVPATLFLAIWFAIQIFSGLTSIGSQMAGGVAWWAHARGFVAGMVLLPLFRKKDRCYYCHKDPEGRWEAINRHP